MILPTILFWVLVVKCREDLGTGGVIFLALLWAALMAGSIFFAGGVYIFIGLLALIDIILLLVIFGEDFPIH